MRGPVHGSRPAPPHLGLGQTGVGSPGLRTEGLQPAEAAGPHVAWGSPNTTAGPRPRAPCPHLRQPRRAQPQGRWAGTPKQLRSTVASESPTRAPRRAPSSRSARASHWASPSPSSPPQTPALTWDAGRVLPPPCHGCGAHRPRTGGAPRSPWSTGANASPHTLQVRGSSYLFIKSEPSSSDALWPQAQGHGSYAKALLLRSWGPSAGVCPGPSPPRPVPGAPPHRGEPRVCTRP